MFLIQAERAQLQKQQELVDLFVVIKGDNMYVCKSVSVCPTDVHITHSTLMTTACLTRTLTATWWPTCPRRSRTFLGVDLHSKVDQALYRIKIELLEMEVSPMFHCLGGESRAIHVAVRAPERVSTLHIQPTQGERDPTPGHRRRCNDRKRFLQRERR